MKSARAIVILAQSILVLLTLLLNHIYDKGFELHHSHSPISLDENIENEDPENLIYLTIGQPKIEVKPYHYEHVSKEHLSNLDQKEERTEPEKVAWKEKLRLRINKEKPAFYKIIKNKVPENVDNDLYIPNTALKYFDISVLAYDPDHLNIIIRDPDNIRWELPHENPYPHSTDTNSFPLDQTNFLFELIEDPFTFKISRKSTGEVIFQFLEPFVYTDRFIEFNFKLPTRHFYGFGERLYKFAFTEGTYSEFILDRAGELEQGKSGYNGQGHHPMYLIKESSKHWHVGYIRNINGQEFVLDGDNNFQYRMIGGVIDLNFFLGDTPEAAVEKYHMYIGGWTIPPFWAMGKHQSKWEGYINNAEMKQMISQYTSHKIPLDVAWSDIEYQEEESINFSIDEKRYPLEEFREIFKNFNKRWIPVIDTYVPKDQLGPAWTYPGVNKLLMKAANGTNYVGFLFRENHIIDFWNPDTPKFWSTMLDQLREKMHFEGIWIDANENTVKETEPGSSTGKYSNLKYWPGKISWYDLKMPKPDAYYYEGIEEIDARNTHCMLQSMYSYEYLKKTNKFPFVLSRANMAGIGKYAFHFYPDVKSTWATMEITVPSTFNFNIFGIPFSGGDLCGMGGEDKTPSLMCARWYQVGVFYPFVRNHHLFNLKGLNNHQEPYTYGGKYYETIVSAIRLRYAMLKYYYTQFFLKPGKNLKYGMVFKPVEFVFYNDETVPGYSDTSHENQFMIGDAIMVTPVLNEQESENEANRKRWVYFPNERWYDLRNYTEVFPKDSMLQVDAPIPGLTPFFLRGGYIFYLQNVDNVLRSDDLDSKFIMIIGFSEDSSGMRSAEGQIMDIEDYSEQNVWERCVDKDCIMDLKCTFDIKEKKFTFESKKRQKEESSKGLYISQFIMIGIDKEIGLGKELKIEGNEIPKSNIEIDRKNRNLKIIFTDNLLNFKDETVFRFNIH